jgi:aldehyde:ferredoxin oxidoreductase
MELYEKGALKSDTELRFGDADLMVDAARKTGYREGIGDMLALGSYRLAEQCGCSELSMSSKKQEFPAYVQGSFRAWPWSMPQATAGAAI